MAILQLVELKSTSFKSLNDNKLKLKSKWTVPTINTISRKMFGYCVEELYDYDIFKNRCLAKLHNPDSNELDEYMWTEFSDYLEESRLFVFNAYMEEGVNECEAYFQSLKFVFSVLKKFRGKFYKELDNRDDYNATPLRTSVNYLMYRVRHIMAPSAYKFSREASNEQLGNFRTDCAWACAEHLAEETGVIFHAKVTL